jgi:hypothetical protein
MIRVAIATLCLPVHGCDTGKGGAVELSWKLRPASSGFADPFVECDSKLGGTGRVAEIELTWTVGAGDAVTCPSDAGSCSSGAGSCCSKRWSCDDHHGATGFDLPEGPVALSVLPICAGQPGDPGSLAAPGTYIAPATVIRTVVRGETVSLNAMEIVVSVSGCATAASDDPNFGAQPCICCTTPGMCPH